MKKLVAMVMILMLITTSTGFAMDMGDLFGGLTAMFSPDADGAYKPGEVAELKHSSIELTNVLEGGKNEFYAPEDGYEFLILEFEIVNEGDKELTISSMLNFNLWCDGEMYSISLEALGTAMFAGKVQLDCVIESGDTFNGVIGYEVPKNWKEVIVEYKTEIIGGDKATFAVSKDE